MVNQSELAQEETVAMPRISTGRLSREDMLSKQEMKG